MIGTIIGLILVILAIFLALKILRSIIIFKVLFRLISLFFIVFMIVLVVNAFFIIRDANDFKKNFINSKNLIMLADSNNTILLAAELDNKTYYNYNDLKGISRSLEKYEFSDINEEYYKIVYIKTESLNNIENIKIKELDINISGEQILDIIKSNTPKKDLDKIISKQDGEPTTMEDSEVKHYLFTYVLTELFNPKNVNVLLKNIKEENILMYENTALFKSVSYIPNMLIKDIT